MKKILIAAVIVSTMLLGCKGKDEKKNETISTATTAENNTATNTGSTGNEDVFDIDVTSLKDEAGFIKAWEDFTTARVADEKKKETDNSYKGHYLEYLKMYTKLKKATTEFSKTIQPAAAAVAFSEKISAIESKMYPPKK
ncbi:MAG: hypothetical protein H7Y01_04535 [Ferruginibacter sp.]|nr:hypothetical protein [Chitinophagaceae bacterium]